MRTRCKCIQCNATFDKNSLLTLIDDKLASKSKFPLLS